jgi:hypothetical protein
MLEAFSGVDNYFQFKPQVTGGVDSHNAQYFDDQTKPTRGDRCLVSFINGNLNNAVIIGMVPHPYSTVSLPSFSADTITMGAREIDEEQTSKNVYPALDMLFNGLRVTINEMGEFLLKKQGAKFVNEDGTKTSSDPLSAVNVSMLDGGLFSVSTSIGQKIQMNASSGDMSMSCVGAAIEMLQTEEDTTGLFIRATDGIYLSAFSQIVCTTERFLLGTDKEIDIDTDGVFSLNIMKTFTLKAKETATVEFGKDFLFKTVGKSTINLEDDIALGAKKKLTATVGDALTLSVDKAFKTTVKDEYSVKSDKSMKMEGKDFLASDGSGAKLVLKGGKAALGNDQAELFQTLYTVFDKILKGGAQFAVGAQGPAVIGPDVSTAIAEFLMSIQKVMGSL